MDYFGDIFNLLKDSLKEFNDNSRASPEAAKFVVALIDQLRHPNEYVREHIALLLAISKNIVYDNFISKKIHEQIAVLLISSKESHEATAQVMQYLCQELKIYVTKEVSSRFYLSILYDYALKMSFFSFTTFSSKNSNTHTVSGNMV